MRWRKEQCGVAQWLTSQEAPPSSTRNGPRDGGGPRAELLGFQRRENAVLVGGNQWLPGASADPACDPPDKQPQSHGQAREPAATQVFRLGYLRCHDCGGGGDDGYILKYSHTAGGPASKVPIGLPTIQHGWRSYPSSSGRWPAGHGSRNSCRRKFLDFLFWDWALQSLLFLGSGNGKS